MGITGLMRIHSTTAIRHLGRKSTISFLLAATFGLMMTLSLREADGQSPPLAKHAAGPIHYAHETRTTPRPLHVHRLKIDLHHKELRTGGSDGQGS